MWLRPLPCSRACSKLQVQGYARLQPSSSAVQRAASARAHESTEGSAAHGHTIQPCPRTWPRTSAVQRAASAHAHKSTEGSAAHGHTMQPRPRSWPRTYGLQHFGWLVGHGVHPALQARAWRDLNHIRRVHTNVEAQH